MPKASDAERWSRLEELFHAAQPLAVAERSKFLQQACPDDAGLRKEVEDLLNGANVNDSFLEGSPLSRTPDDPTCSLVGSALDELAGVRPSIIGQTIGHYKVVREIGAGGMGRVYLAVRSDDFDKTVAIKLLRADPDSETLIARFRIERQILAAFDHPNIARLLDGGTTKDGLPYLVMEYIEGQPVTTYCDDRSLSIAARLRLFLFICSAVEYAHKNLVVHRDLKPSNILVTESGTPKLLDFGIAKMLEPELAPVTLMTAADARPMTPEYASPEQVFGSPITTAADVYSLGAVLYELLTGHRLFRFQSRTLHEIFEIARNVEPVRPSAAVGDCDAAVRNTNPQRLRRLLAGDLDNIVMRALQKEPSKRYGSVEQFADDVRRYLDGFPVVARKETFWYRAGKFVRRNKGQFAAAVVLLLTLAAGIAATAWQARRAERRFQDVRKLAGSVLFELYDEIEKLPGSTQAREILVKRALEYLDSLAREASGDTSLQLELAAAYERVGAIQWNRFFGNLGDVAGALKSQQKALEIRRAIAGARPDDETAQRGLAGSYLQMGDLESQNGDPKAAFADYQESLKLRQQIVAAHPKDWDARRSLATAYDRVGDILGNPNIENLGDIAGASAAYNKMQALWEQLVAERPGDIRTRNGLAIGYERLGYIKNAQGDLNGSLELHRKALAIYEDNARRHPEDARVIRNLGSGYEQIGLVQLKIGDAPAAMESFNRAVSLGERLAAADPRNFGAHNDLVDRLGSFAAAAQKAGRFAEASEYTARRLAIAKSWAERAGATAIDWNQYALVLLTCEPPKMRQLPLALSAAKRAAQLSQSKDPAILDTLALAYSYDGEREQAIKTERAAVAAAGTNAALLARCEAALRKYEAASVTEPR